MSLMYVGAQQRPVCINAQGCPSFPLIPWPLAIMNEHEFVKYRLPELKKDMVENTGQTVSSIAWGSEHDHPQLWANDLAPWCSVGNINHTQQTKFGIPFINVIQETKNQNEGLR